MNVIDKPLALPMWTQSTGEELANSISHGIGLVGAIVGTPVLLLAAFHHGGILLSYRYTRFRRNDVAAVFGIDALPCLAANAGKIYPASAGGFVPPFFC